MSALRFMMPIRTIIFSSPYRYRFGNYSGNLCSTPWDPTARNNCYSELRQDFRLGIARPYPRSGRIACGGEYRHPFAIHVQPSPRRLPPLPSAIRPPGDNIRRTSPEVRRIPKESSLLEVGRLQRFGGFVAVGSHLAALPLDPLVVRRGQGFVVRLGERLIVGLHVSIVRGLEVLERLANLGAVRRPRLLDCVHDQHGCVVGMSREAEGAG